MNRDDTEARNRLVRGLVRGGQHEEAAELLAEIDRPLEAARILDRHGHRLKACKLLGIRWRCDPEELPELYLKREALNPAEIAELVQPDLDEIDVVRLYTSFPRRGDGLPSKNHTFYLARYRPHVRGQHYRRLVLVAWTPGSASYWDHPDDRKLEKPVITVELGIRSHRKKLWPRELWTRMPPAT